MSTIDLRSLNFPIYKLGLGQPTIDGGLVYYETKAPDEENFKKRIIDNRAIPGKTLAIRRLQLSNNDKYRINTAIFFLGDFIKLADSGVWFIDTTGLVFTYTKTKFVPLVCRKIKKIISSNSTGKIIEVEGVPNRFKTLFAPPDSHAYCLLLKVNNSYIFYGTVQDRCRDTRRKI